MKEVRLVLEFDPAPFAARFRAEMEAPSRRGLGEWDRAVERLRSTLGEASKNIEALTEAAQRAAVESPVDRVTALRRLTDLALAAREMGKPVRPGYIRTETIERAARLAARKGK